MRNALLGLAITAAAAMPAAGQYTVQVQDSPVRIDVSAQADSAIRAASLYHLSTGKEWVGCAPIGLGGPIFQVTTSRAGSSGAGNPAGLCPSGMTLAHTHHNWDRQPSKTDCRNFSSRRPPYDVIILADATAPRIIVYARCDR